MSGPAFGDDLTVQVLHYAIDGLSLQQNTTASNISNDNTPGYTAQEVDFQSSLQNAMNSPDGGTASVSTYLSAAEPGTNGNNVDLTQEMVGAEKSTLQYQAVVQAMNFKFQLLTNALQA